MKQHVATLLAEIERCLQAQAGTLSESEIEAQLAAVRTILNAPEREVLIALRQLGLDVLSAMKARLRREVERRDPRRPVIEEERILH